MKQDASQRLLDQVADQIDRHNMVAAGDRVLVALSGGPDSMALVHGLLQLCRSGRLGQCTVCLAHLNHCLRGEESDEDEAFVRDYAGQLKLPLTVERIDVGQAVRDGGGSIETEARRQRYGFLERAARQNGCQKIAFGHHADDNVETILHRLLRGTGLKGLAGIPAVRSLGDLQIVRPLLQSSREDIMAFLRDNKVPYRHDASNDAAVHTRNRLRHELLPLLRGQYNPRIDQALLRLAHIAGLYGGLVSEDSAAMLEAIVLEHTGERLGLCVESFNKLHRVARADIVHHALASLGVGLGGIGFEQITRILDMADGAADQVTQLPGSVTVRRERERLVFERKKDTGGVVDVRAAVGPTTLVIPGVTVLPAGLLLARAGECQPVRSIRVEAVAWAESPLDILKTDKRSAWAKAHPTEVDRDKAATQECLDADCVEGPLVVRTWEPGDRFWPLGAGGSKTLGDFFTDCHVPPGLRRCVPLLCDGRGIVWVVGLRMAERVKITGATCNVYRVSAE